jgi:hypothetical protein
MYKTVNVLFFFNALCSRILNVSPLFDTNCIIFLTVLYIYILDKISLQSSVYVCLLPTVEFNCLIYKLNCGGCQLTKITAGSKIISTYGSVQTWVHACMHISVPEFSKFRYLIKLISEINLDYSTSLHFEHSAWQKGVCTTWTKRITMGLHYMGCLSYI